MSFICAMLYLFVEPRVAQKIVAMFAMNRRIANDAGMLPNIEVKDPEAADEYQGLLDGMPNDQKTAFLAAVRDVVELNGSGDTPGVAASFIRRNEFVQMLDIDGLGARAHKAIFLALNFAACGRGLGGACAAAVRYALRDKFDVTRECTVHDGLPAGVADLIGEYKNATTNKEDVVNFFMTNALSVAALAGALMNKTGHHWNSDHRHPQIAFINSMGLKDSFGEQDYRKAFYLAIHPLPLAYTEALRRGVTDGQIQGVAEVVRMRSGGPPCGYGIINVCASVAPSLLREGILDPALYVDEIEIAINPDADAATIQSTQRKNRDIRAKIASNAAIRNSIPGIRAAIGVVVQTNTTLCERASEYHMFATHYGHASRVFLDIEALSSPMILLAGYIMSKIGGSLSKSPALAKFIAQHPRDVGRAIAAFDASSEGENLVDVLCAAVAGIHGGRA